MNGYDYDHQAWVVNGKYVRCGHPEAMDCGCYGRVHVGEPQPEPNEHNMASLPVCAVCGRIGFICTSSGVNLCREHHEQALKSELGM